MTYRLDLTALNARELKRMLPGDITTAPVLAGARLLKKPVFAPDEFPSTLELRIAVEADWDNLGASIQAAHRVKSMRDSLVELGCVQVGAFRLANMPYHRNFFAYTKEADTFAALYLSDAAGPAPYLELFTLFRQEKNGKIGVVTSSAILTELDPSENLIWLPDPGAEVNHVFQLHRSKILETGKANKSARTVEDFTKAFLSVQNANYTSWLARGVLK
jgi:hypothetical protein